MSIRFVILGLMASSSWPTGVSPAWPILRATSLASISESLRIRVSTDEQDLTRQSEIEQRRRTSGHQVACVYGDKGSSARAGRPELLWMIAGLEPGEAAVAEKFDRMSRVRAAENSVAMRGFSISRLGTLLSFGRYGSRPVIPSADVFARSWESRTRGERRWQGVLVE